MAAVRLEVVRIVQAKSINTTQTVLIANSAEAVRMVRAQIVRTKSTATDQGAVAGIVEVRALGLAQIVLQASMSTKESDCTFAAEAPYLTGRSGFI